MQGPALGKDEPPCSGASWDLTRGSSFAEKSLGILADGAGHKPEVCPGSKEGQQHPGLYDEVQSWEMEETDHPLLPQHSLDSI